MPTELDFRCRCGHFESDHRDENPARPHQARPCHQCLWCLSYMSEHERPEPLLSTLRSWLRRRRNDGPEGLR